MSDPKFGFVATLSCGHAIEMVADVADMDDEIIDLYDNNIGRDIRRLPIDEVRAIPIYVRDCETCRTPPPVRKRSY